MALNQQHFQFTIQLKKIKLLRRNDQILRMEFTKHTKIQTDIWKTFKSNYFVNAIIPHLWQGLVYNVKGMFSYKTHDNVVLLACDIVWIERSIQTFQRNTVSIIRAEDSWWLLWNTGIYDMSLHGVTTQKNNSYLHCHENIKSQSKLHG